MGLGAVVGLSFVLLLLAFRSLLLPRGCIQAYLPLLTFVVLFGLSMDYEVFLISRMTAGVITAAAAIMIVVFAAFMITDVVEVKQMGFALAVAVAVDATLIRIVVVPALMRLTGRASWWFPAVFAGRGGGGSGGVPVVVDHER